MEDKQILTGQRFFVLLLSVWFGMALIISRNNWFRYLPTGFAGMIAIGGIPAILAFYFYWAPFRVFINSIPMKHLTLFHIWRIGAGLIFLDKFHEGELPWIFARNAGIGDIIVGVMVLLLFLFFKESDRSYKVFHILSFMDFILAVGTGLVLRFIVRDLVMIHINLYPQALMPLFGVPVTGALSIIALKRLFARE